MDTEESFGRWLRRFRRVNDLTQESLAQQIGCSVVTIRKIEADERRPSKALAERIADCLNTPSERRTAFIAFARQRPEAVPPYTVSGTFSSFSKRQHAGPVGNLSSPVTTLIGRDHEVTAASNSLLNDKVRLLTLIGPPGIGKTRLGLEVVARLQDAFEHGVYFVTLAPISDPAMVLKEIAQALGVKETGEAPLASLVTNFLRDRCILLALDNFEHVMTAAPVVLDLLERCVGLKLLVTSRAALHLQGEWQFPVPPLLLPDLNQIPSVETLLRYAAVALFVERAQAVDPRFILDHENAPFVAAICAHLDGLPLAIELAAVWTKLLAPRELLAHLNSHLSLLLDTRYDLPTRHRTLRAALDWSYELLDEQERDLLLHLSVFVDGGTLAAVETIYGEQTTTGAVRGPIGSRSGAHPQSSNSFLSGMVSLIDKSLVFRQGQTDGQVRVGMLETIRTYALEQLDKRGDGERIRGRHAANYLMLAESAEPELRGPRQMTWLERLEKEHNNFRAALDWALKRPETEIALRLSGALWRFWEVRGHLSEGRKWLEESLDQSRTLAEEASSSPSYGAARAKALNSAGKLAIDLGENARAQQMCAESLALWRALGDELGAARTLYTLGVIARHEGDYVQAVERFGECLAISRRWEDRVSIYLSLYNLAEICLAQGQYDQMVALHEESLALKREQGDALSIATSLTSLAQWAEIQGDYVEATALYKESLMLRWQQGDKWGITQSLRGLAAVAAVTWQPVRAARLFAAVESLLKVSGASLSPSLYTRTSYERDIAVTRTQMEETLFLSLWAEGSAMSLDQVLAYALGS